MKNNAFSQFVHYAEHNLKSRKKTLKVLLTIVIICLALIAISLIFWNTYTYKTFEIKTGKLITAGWPSNLFTISFWFALAFILFWAVTFFSIKKNMPSVAVNESGLYLNQNYVRNLFVSWNEIKAIENIGNENNPRLKMSFKNPDQALKGQFFLYKSISKSSFKQDIFRIEQKNNIGDLNMIYNYSKRKING